MYQAKENANNYQYRKFSLKEKKAYTKNTPIIDQYKKLLLRDLGESDMTAISVILVFARLHLYISTDFGTCYTK